MYPRILAIFLALAPFANAGDWPRWRGPDLDGISKEEGLKLTWDSEPKQLWTAQVGTGYSSVSVVGDRVFAFGLQEGERKLLKKAPGTEVLRCLDANTGDEIWSREFPSSFKPKFYDGGTSGTPTIDDGVVYVLRQTGEVLAVNASDGKTVWETNLAQKLGIEIGTWGLTGAPLVEGDLLILNAGTHGTALDKKTGEIVWKSGAGLNGYATPIPFESGGKRLIAIFSGKGLHAVEPTKGALAWTHPWETKYDVNAADPIPLGDGKLFISSGYKRGAAVLKTSPGGAEVVWENTNIRTQLSPAVLVGGYLYGIDGDTSAGARATLNCVDPKDGSVKWTAPTGFGAVAAAGDTLIVLSAGGELITARATPEKFDELARAQVIKKKCWTTPTLAHGKLYVRNQAGTLVCLDVSG